MEERGGKRGPRKDMDKKDRKKGQKKKARENSHHKENHNYFFQKYTDDTKWYQVKNEIRIENKLNNQKDF